MLGPQFDRDIFVHDESAAITAKFVRGLSSLYAGRTDVDRCTLFSDRGLATALLADAHLRAADRREQFVDGQLILRVAFEGNYDLRIKPPRVPIDAIFDLPAGATVTDAASGDIAQTRAAERIGLRLDFVFDGHVWLVDLVGPVSAEYADWARTPEPVPPGPPCAGFVRSAPGAAFDDRADRIWCTDDGNGRTIVIPDQLSIVTRYPCGGHAAVLTIGRPLGARIDPLVRWEYVRDPRAEFRRAGWLAAHYEGDTVLPADARSTGWTNGNVTLWISP
ncbi:MAG: hypothetical protein QOE42_912, partial [Chloroflexota bacterium]|nr:hypothetical protein [Chloroflexota bacterium]